MRITSRSRLPAASVAATVGLAVTLAGCGSNSAPPAARPPERADRMTGTVTVLAAASLTEAFGKIADDFEREHPGVQVKLSFAGSSTLASQIEQGIPADVFASADTQTMQQVASDGDLAGRAAVFTRNRLQIAVPRGNPAHVRGLADFADADLSLALCAKEVPCGAAADKAFHAAGVTPRPDTLEKDVKAVLTKVRSGEVDAGIVYRTDVLSAGRDVEGIDFPEAAKAINAYPIASLHDAPNPRAARAFVAYVRSAAGRRVLSRDGFGQP